MVDVKKFIENNIIVDRFPSVIDTNLGRNDDVNVIINVSDEFYIENYLAIMERGVFNMFYFPMGEYKGNMNLGSIYGAMQVLHSIYVRRPDFKVLIHCQAGKNRSPTVRSAFYFMMTGEHEPDMTKSGGRNNRLVDNCERGNLPPIKDMEKFLLNCREAFEHPERFFGGIFDWVKDNSITSDEQHI